MKTLITATFALAVAGVVPSFAADLIEDYPRVAHRRSAYVVQEVQTCSMLMIDYRRPYPARRDLVAVCYPPLDLSPASSVDTPGRNSRVRATYALR